MKKLKLTLCLFMASLALFANHKPVDFQTTNIQEGILAAANAQKLLIAHFVADWCMPSQWMEEHTFKHPSINHYLTEDYLPIKVDIDQAAGFQDKEQYQVETLPTVLIFSAGGNLLERIEGITDVADLRNYLRKHNLRVHKRTPAHLQQKPEPSASPIDFSHLDRPAFEYSEGKDQPTTNSVTISTPNLPMTMEEVFGPQATASASPLADTPEPTSGNLYGVEVAILRQYSAVVRYVRTLERRVSDKVFILLSREQNQKNYHVIIGKVPNRRAAYELRKRLLAHQIEGSIKVLDTR